jgi:heat shock protein HtpX
MWNHVKTTLLFATLTGLFVLIGNALGGVGGMVLAFGFAILMNMGAWWFSDSLALKMSGARPLPANESPELYEIVARLSQRAQIPTPALYLIESPTPNAFATGRSPAKGAVAVTTGLLHLLDREEVAGVVAHELAHIKNRDTLISSIAATIGGAITMIAEMATWALIFGGFGGSNDEEEGAGSPAGTLLMLLVAPIAALIIQLAISRVREYRADADGAAILGDPLPLASALEKLEWAGQRVTANVNPATSHLYIVNPQRAGQWLASLFRTHPDTGERIQRLRAMAVQQRRMVFSH